MWACTATWRTARFAPPEEVAWSGLAYSPALGDVNDDQKLDIVGSGGSGGIVVVINTAR